MTTLTVNLNQTFSLNDEQFETICNNNKTLKFERNSKGELIIMSLTGGETGRRNLKLCARFDNWNSQKNLGVGFDSSTGFKLPSGAIRSPDLAYITKERWNNLTPIQKKKYVPLCPDFLVELKSASDEIEDLQRKMQEYLENGLKLGWLIDPESQNIYIYKPHQSVIILNNPQTISGEDILPDFVLDLTGILTD